MESVEQIRQDALRALERARTLGDLQEVEREYLGRKQGRLTTFLRSLPRLPAADRPATGKIANELRKELTVLLKQKRSTLAPEGPTDLGDLSVPGLRPRRGTLHPLTLFVRRMEEIWRSMGFSFHQGPELETDWYNFSGLNIPKHHPSRDIQDTFYIRGEPNLVLRTHTSTAQLRAMEQTKPPARIIEFGRVYRNERTDASHESTFFQCDGFAIDRAVRVTDLIGTLTGFLETLFDRRLTIRVRPHFYPFVEPGMDLDMVCILCAGGGCPVCSRSGWLEMVGAGMIHPRVLRNMKLDPSEWTGFAFGMGVDRLAMLYHRYTDIRLAHGGDLRFLRQFQ